VIRLPGNDRVAAGYRFGSAMIDVEADDADAARWLHEFLTPWFEAIAPGKGQITVRLTVSAAAFTDLAHRHAVAICHPVACFALDSEVVSLPGWAAADGSTVIADSGRGCFYRLRPLHVEIIAPPGGRGVRVGLMRVVREFAAARMLRQPTVIDLHAAAFVVGGRAVLIVGPKEAGKTTLLVHALASGCAELLANDRVFVDAGQPPADGTVDKCEDVLREPQHERSQSPSNKGFSAHPSEPVEGCFQRKSTLPDAIGMPTLVSLRDDTLHLFPDLRRDFPVRPALLHAAELAAGDTGSVEHGEAPPRFALSPAQLAQRIGVGIVRRAPIAAIVFPEISPAADAWSLEPLTPADAAARLRRCLYGARTAPRPATVFDDFAGCASGCRAEQAELAHGLAVRLPLFRCCLGRDAYRDGAEAWLRALALDAPGGARVA
jgi:hypothetical protein